MGYLTSEQALADFAELVSYVKSANSGADNCPVIAFGGSYGGMLSAWMRIKYPHIITGYVCNQTFRLFFFTLKRYLCRAIAASAPILQFTGLTPCDAFNRVVTADFTSSSTECAETIRKSWGALSRILANGEIDKYAHRSVFHIILLRRDKLNIKLKIRERNG